MARLQDELEAVVATAQHCTGGQEEFAVGEYVVVYPMQIRCKVLGYKRDPSGVLLYCLSKKRRQAERQRFVNEVDYYAEAKNLRSVIEW